MENCFWCYFRHLATVIYIYVIFRPWSVRIGKNCARGLDYVVVDCYFFFSAVLLRKQLLCSISITAVQFKSGERVRLTFRAQIAVLFAEFVGLILHVPLCREISRLTKLDFGQKCPLCGKN